MTDDFASFTTVVSRSELQAYAECPMQARLRAERKGTVGDAAVIGEQVHQAFGRTCQEYIDSGGNLTLREVVESLDDNLRSSRADVQPEVLKACVSWSVWGLANYLVQINPLNLCHFDGGQGEKTGQLAWDIEALGIRVTGEMDFVHTPDPEFLKVLDLKSGWKQWTDDDVRDSFQFAVYAWLLFQKYERVQTIQFSVWMTRFGRRTPFVDFQRRRMPDLYARILSAADDHARYERCVIENVEARPSIEKCGQCDCSRSCPVAEREFTEDSPDLIEQFVVVDAKWKALEKTLKARVAKTGQRIRSPSGAMFGTDKPSSRKTWSLWSDKPGDDAE